MPASDKYWRPLKRMHVVFAISCLALLVVTLMMMGDDHGREWKDVQRTAEKIDTLRLQLDLYEQGALSGEETSSLAESLSEEQRQALAVYVTSDESSYAEAREALEKAQKTARKEQKSRQAEIDAVEAEIEELALAFDLASRRDRNQKAVRDKARADYDLAVRDQLPEPRRQTLFQNFEAQQAKVEENVLEVQRAKTALDAKSAERDELTRTRDELAARLAALEADEQRVRAARNKLAPDDWVASLKRKTMELPIIDGFNGHLRIRQDWLPDLDITLGMSTTARFDRCRTCHVNADAVVAGGAPAYPHGHSDSEDYRDWVAENAYPHPFSTHPRTDLYTTATSPHPVTTFGCTICHQGNGSGTSFQDAEHGPNDPDQEHAWAEEYGYHPNHFWEYPMHSQRFVESSCIKCHHDVVELGVNPTYGATAPKVVEGFETISTYGCFGCHEVHGYDGDERIGPDLRTEPNYAAAAAQVLADPVLADAGGDATITDSHLQQIVAELALREDTVVGSLSDPTADPSDQKAAAADFVTWVDEVTPRIQAAIPGVAKSVVEDQDRNADRQLLRQLLSTADKLVTAHVKYVRRAEMDDSSVEPLSARTRGLASALEDQPHPGKLRKVGPALRHVGSKTSRGWLEFWTVEPKQFRPTTRMPQFWGLSNQEDDLAHDLTPVEVAAVVQYLLDKSQAIDLLSPAEDYQPDAVAGAESFARKGCLACHQHASFPTAKADFGPDLSRVFAKIKPDFQKEDGSFDAQSEGFRWLYTWILEPHRHHARSRMPNLYVNDEAEEGADPAADIAAFLLSSSTKVVLTAVPPRPAIDDAAGEVLIQLLDADDARYGELIEFLGEDVLDVDPETEVKTVEAFVADLPKVVGVFGNRAAAEELMEELQDFDGVVVELQGDEIADEYDPKGYFDVDQKALDQLVEMNLTKALTEDAAEKVFASREYPIPADRIKGDEIELAGAEAESDEEWYRRRMNYVGRRTISRYGCYGCHDVPGFETARPIGTVLQDWGRKDTSKLATEHIHEYLEHHGKVEEAELAVAKAAGEEYKSAEDREDALRPAYFLEDLLHHGRAGFLWQKLVAPRSYDYEKVETKGYDERLRMPLFPFDDEQREAVATFVLGLVAEPPPAEYVYQPDPVAADRIEGEFLLKKYNCVGCHYVEMPKHRIALDLENGDFTSHDSLDTLAESEGVDFFADALQKLVQVKPVRQAWVGETKDGKAIVEFHGLLDSSGRDPEEPLSDVDFNFDVFQTWENLDVSPPGKPAQIVTVDSEKITVAPTQVLSTEPARGGEYTEFLVGHLGEGDTAKKLLAWQSGPPPLVGEGAKVQTPWLYRFLRNPYRIRPMAVVRMPRFNMSPAEARTLANYFAAKDGVPYPYQALEQTEPEYLADRGAEFDLTGPEYLEQSWQQLHNSKVQCYKCHEYAANVFSGPITYMKDTRGPNLGRVSNRLRPEWMYVWLSKPRWLLPYTGMPVNYGKPKPGAEPKSDFFGGNPDAQVIGVRNALLNYPRAVEEFGKIEPPAAAPPAEPTAPAATEE